MRKEFIFSTNNKPMCPIDVEISTGNTYVSEDIHHCLNENETFLTERLDYIKQYFLKEIRPEELQKVAILVVGSDGRMENSPGSITISPTEFCILAENDVDTFPVLKAINDGIQHGLLQAIDAGVEIKTLKNNPPGYVLSGYRGNPHHAWPDRILDAQFLLGSHQYVQAAREQLFTEGDTNANLRKSLRNYHNYYSRITQTGSNNTTLHFDSITGQLFFDPEQHVRGLKYGPIRLIQSLLTYRQMALGGNDGNLPSSTIQKLQILYPHEMNVIEAYQQALLIYHQQQYWRSRGETGYMVVDPDMLYQICQTIYTFDKEEYQRLNEIWNIRIISFKILKQHVLWTQKGITF